MAAASDRKKLALVVLALTLLAGCSAMSIENEPVKVTHRNSGPRYQIDDGIDRPKLTPVAQSAPETASESPTSKPQEEPTDSAAEQAIPVGHVSIRRVFLVPVSRPSRPDSWLESVLGGNPAEPTGRRESEQEPSGMFARPLWPFLTPAQPPRHLFGADEASRSPAQTNGPNSARRDQDDAGLERAASGEREGGDRFPMMMPPPREHQREPEQAAPMFDPIQMMIDMMQQAINGQLGPMPNSPDLNKEASGDQSPDQADERAKAPASGAEKPLKPASQNETREDIVEIEGKKYLRKTVINRHVGENIIFMTKRLIFVPLNETESGEQQPPAITTTTTEALPSSTPAPASNEQASTTLAAERRSPPMKPLEEATTTTTTSTSEPATTEAATTTTTTTEQPTTTMNSDAAEPTTKAKESWVDRVSEAIDKAAERLVERVQSTTSSTTTEKPASS